MRILKRDRLWQLLLLILKFNGECRFIILFFHPITPPTHQSHPSPSPSSFSSCHLHHNLSHGSPSLTVTVTSPWVWTNTIKLHKPTQLSHLIFQHCHFNPRNTLRYYCHNNIACFITFSNYTNIFLEYPDILNLFAWLMMFKWETGLWGQPKIILPPTVFFLFHLKYFLWCSG